MIPLFLYTKIKVATQKDRIFESVVFVLIHANYPFCFCSF